MTPNAAPLNPRWFPYGSFPLYLLKGFQGLLSALPGVEIHDLRVLGRGLSALADTATVALVYLLGARLYGRREGLLAAILVALAVLHVQLSHFFAVDTIMAACAVAAVYLLARVAKEGRTRDSLAAGVVIGLGIATKVTLMPIYGAFVMAHLIYALGLLDSGESDGRTLADRVSAALTGLLLGGAASVVVFAAVQPYAFIDFARFMGDVVEQSEMVRRIRDYPYTRQYVDTTPTGTTCASWLRGASACPSASSYGPASCTWPCAECARSTASPTWRPAWRSRPRSSYCPTASWR